MARSAIKKPSALDPASPISMELGEQLKYRYAMSTAEKSDPAIPILPRLSPKRSTKDITVTITSDAHKPSTPSEQLVTLIAVHIRATPKKK